MRSTKLNEKYQVQGKAKKCKETYQEQPEALSENKAPRTTKSTKRNQKYQVQPKAPNTTRSTERNKKHKCKKMNKMQENLPSTTFEKHQAQ